MASVQQPEAGRPPGPTWTVASSRVWCDRLAARSASNFYPAFRLLPSDQRLAMATLYAFMRVTDDLVDGDEPQPDRRLRLSAWQTDLHAALDRGVDRHPLHPALRDTIERYRVPIRYLDDVIEGVGMDLEVSSYPTFTDLYPYCYRVASAVGLACIAVWGCHDPAATAPAEAAGIALQLTNILRDVPEDAARGRIYLPREDLERFGYPAVALAQGVHDERFRALMCFEAGRALMYYEKASALVPLLPRPGRAVFLMMLRTYRALLQEIIRSDFDVFRRRARLGTFHKVRLALRSLAVRWGLSAT
jgi:phytoene synthase